MFQTLPYIWSKKAENISFFLFVFILFKNKAPSMISKFHLVISSSINLLFPEECDPLQLEESRGHFLQNGMTSKSSFSYILNPWEEGKSQNMTCSSFYIIIFPFILKFQGKLEFLISIELRI